MGFASAVEAMLAGDVDTGKTILRDYIKATDGFDAWATPSARCPRA